MEEKRKIQMNTIDPLEMVLFLVKKWIWLVLATVIGGLIAMGYYQFTVTPRYKASAEIYMTNSGTVINFQDIQLSSVLKVDYTEIFLSRKVLKSVIKDQNLNMDYRTLKGMISVTNPKDSHCMIISATASSEQQALDITNSLVEHGVDQIYRILGKDQPSIIDSAEADAVDKIQASKQNYITIGAVAGLLIVSLFFVVRFMTNTTLKSEEDIEKYLSLNVLAVVPEAHSK